jgi:hypothetical protein
LPPSLRVLVLDRVEAVRAGHDDLGDAELAEHLDVLRGEHLEEHLVAGAASRVTGAGLAVAEHGIRDPGRVSSSATARVVFLARSSKAPAQPTQKR